MSECVHFLTVRPHLLSWQPSYSSHHSPKTSLSRITSDLTPKFGGCLSVLLSLTQVFKTGFHLAVKVSAKVLQVPQERLGSPTAQLSI